VLLQSPDRSMVPATAMPAATRPAAIQKARWYPSVSATAAPSPRAADLTGLPPMLIQAATGDPLLGEAGELAEHAQDCGVDARFELFPVDTHDFHLFWSLLPEAAQALQQAGRFVRDPTLAAQTG
jgi:acetyl esterase/lipase